jgi:hypothetical protein
MMNLNRFLVLVTLVVLAELLPHPPNFAPIGALALFAGACFADRRLAFLVPLAALCVSHLFLGAFKPQPWQNYVALLVVYASFAGNVLLGRLLRWFLAGSPTSVPLRRSIEAIGLTATATLLGSIQFFIVTNFACWALWFPHTLEGLLACYVGALEFFRYTVQGDATYATALFGGLALIEFAFPRLRERSAEPSPA